MRRKTGVLTSAVDALPWRCLTLTQRSITSFTKSSLLTPYTECGSAVVYPDLTGWNSLQCTYIRYARPFGCQPNQEVEEEDPEVWWRQRECAEVKRRSKAGKKCRLRETKLPPSQAVYPKTSSESGKMSPLGVAKRMSLSCRYQISVSLVYRYWAYTGQKVWEP